MLERTTFDWEAAFAGRAQHMRGSEIRELLKVLDQPGMLSFAGGIPDPDLFPRAAVARACAEIMADPAQGASALQYTLSEGYLPLRRWIADHMGAMGVPCEAENIVITGGSQQGLDLLGKLFLSPGDTALLTAPTYLGALQAFSAYEPRHDQLDPIHGNMTSAAFAEAARSAGSRVALAYVVPDFANPTGETLTEAARCSLLDLVDDLGTPLIEDAAYTAIRFEGDAVPSCLALDVRRRGHIDAARVAYCGTFSKTISPGLRVGWICAARDLVHKVVLAKQASDLHAASLNQMIVHRVAAAHFDQLVPQVVDTYRRRRDAMLEALDRSMPAGARWTRPAGGMFVWLTLPDRIDTARLLELALAEKVAFVPGSAFYADGRGGSSLRLSYSLQSEDAIAEGMRRLGVLIARTLS